MTRDEIAGPRNLDLWLGVKGERRQRGGTHTMVFDGATLVACCGRS